MAFEVFINATAFDDLDLIAGFIKREASLKTAQEWFSAILSAIETLREMPNRCPFARESDELGEEVRLLLHGNRKRAYKIYFKVLPRSGSGGIVQVLHIRHWARKSSKNSYPADAGT